MLREGQLSSCGCGLAHFDAVPGPQEDLSRVGMGSLLYSALPAVGSLPGAEKCQDESGEGHRGFALWDWSK